MQFTLEQVAELRNSYGAIDRIDPEGRAYAGLVAILNATSQDDLKMLADAGIKWVSSLARNRIKNNFAGGANVR